MTDLEHRVFQKNYRTQWLMASRAIVALGLFAHALFRHHSDLWIIPGH
jgi:hypothetical protein